MAAISRGKTKHSHKKRGQNTVLDEMLIEFAGSHQCEKAHENLKRSGSEEITEANLLYYH